MSESTDWWSITMKKQHFVKMCAWVCLNWWFFFYWMLMCIFESRAHIHTLHGIDNKSEKQMRGIRKKKQTITATIS